MEADGSQRQLLASIPYNLSYYGLSPDGTKLAMGLRPRFLNIMEISSGEIIKTIPHAGVNELHEVAEKGNIVSWSPDGNRFVFLREKSALEGIELVLYDMLTDTQLVLTADEALYRSPVWSPDGKKIAVASMPSCGILPWQCPPENNNWDIVVFDLDKQSSQKLTYFDDIAGRFQDIWSKSLCNLQWSPKGDYILFENSCSQFGFNEGKEIFVVSAKGEDVIQLTNFDYDDSRYIVHYTAKWLAPDNQLFVGYSIIPIPPSSGLTAQYGYDIYQDNNFHEAHSAVLSRDDTIFYPQWTTFAQQFVSTQEHKDSGCRQLFWSEFINSEFTAITKDEWPLLAIYSDVLRSPNGNFLAYLTTGNECEINNGIKPRIVLIDLSSEQIAVLDIGELQGDMALIDWFEILTVE